LGEIITVKQGSFGKKIKVLVAPLDWGLGHSTRCIKIIKELLLNDYEVIIACEGTQLLLLKREFPSLNYINLKGYRIKYGRNRLLTICKIIFQIPKILIQIKTERGWLNRIIGKEKIDIIISDNRFGLYSKKITSVFITHQLCIKTAFGPIIENILQKLNYRYINKFAVCWVPDDFEKEKAIAGILSHPVNFPNIPVHYIGILSRFEKKELSAFNKLIIILSGPEPQRTILENIFLKELKFYSERAILIRGLPNETKKIDMPSNIQVYNHLPSMELNNAICSSEWVICRSGYSSVMDLVRLSKKSILIPTPGQSEQEYLADYLHRKRLALNAGQKNFSLQKVLDIAKHFEFKQYDESDKSSLQDAIISLPKVKQPH